MQITVYDHERPSQLVSTVVTFDPWPFDVIDDRGAFLPEIPE